MEQLGERQVDQDTGEPDRDQQQRLVFLGDGQVDQQAAHAQHHQRAPPAGPERDEAGDAGVGEELADQAKQRHFRSVDAVMSS